MNSIEKKDVRVSARFAVGVQRAALYARAMAARELGAELGCFSGGCAGEEA